MKLSLNIRIFVVLSVIMAASLLVIWLVLCPKYEAIAVSERMADIRRLQIFAVGNLDRVIADWSHEAEIIAAQVAERPKEGEAVLRAIMALRPEIIQVKIRSVNLSDELVSQNTAYPSIDTHISDSAWVPSKQDSVARFAWISRGESPKQLFVVQKQFYVEKLPFVLTVFWDARRLNEIFSELPLGRGYSASIFGPSAVLVHDTSTSLNVDDLLGTVERTREVQSIREEETSWRVLTSPFPSARLWMVIAIPEKTIAGPAEEFMLYSTSLVVGLTLVLLILGWLLSHQARRATRRHEPAKDGSGG